MDLWWRNYVTCHESRTCRWRLKDPLAFISCVDCYIICSLILRRRFIHGRQISSQQEWNKNLLGVLVILYVCILHFPFCEFVSLMYVDTVYILRSPQEYSKRQNTGFTTWWISLRRTLLGKNSTFHNKRPIHELCFEAYRLGPLVP